MSEMEEEIKMTEIKVAYTAERLQLLFDKILNCFEGEEINKADLRSIFDEVVDHLRTLSKNETAKLNKDLNTVKDQSKIYGH